MRRPSIGGLVARDYLADVAEPPLRAGDLLADLHRAARVGGSALELERVYLILLELALLGAPSVRDVFLRLRRLRERADELQEAVAESNAHTEGWRA